MSRNTSPAPAVSPFLALPAEIHSHIASYLTLEQLIPFLSLHPTLLSLTQSHLSPLPSLIRHTLNTTHLYPPILARLPSLRLFIPDDGGRLFIDVLVQARPRWILERLELGRWTEAVWQEAFERRFLPSWKRYKADDDTWRAVFLRLEHRNIGCTHEESWTRFITLHRNGSASINRIYSRQFDPYQIYDELKHQNNFASEPTTVRVVVHLQDVRIIVLGVLYRHPSLFVNQNAHDLLHPPLLRDIPLTIDTELVNAVAQEHSESESGSGLVSSRGKSKAIVSGSNATAAINPSANSNEVYFPLVRSLSPNGPQLTSYGLADGPLPSSGGLPASSSSSTSSPPPLTTRRSTFSAFLPSSSKSKDKDKDKDKRPSYPNITVPLAMEPPSGSSMARLGAMLTLTRSRDSDDSPRGRKWVMGRRRSSGSGSEKGGSNVVIPAAALFTDQAGSSSSTHLPNSSHASEGAGMVVGGGRRVIPAAALFTDYASTSAPGPSILSNPNPPVSALANGGSSTEGGDVFVSDTAAIQSDIADAPPLATLPVLRPRQYLPYPPMRKPQPTRPYRFYPNFTSPGSPEPPGLISGLAMTGHSSSAVEDGAGQSAPVTSLSPPGPVIPRPDMTDPAYLFDRRMLHETIEDDYAGNLWAHRRRSSFGAEDEEHAHVWDAANQEERVVEWDEVDGVRKRWVGPVIVVAQIHPSYHPRAQPPGVDPLLPTEGANPDLGPKGMYVSMGFEDLEAIMGWVELKGGGAYVADPRRGGMGF